jgi:hypothetical protein
MAGAFDAAPLAAPFAAVPELLALIAGALALMMIASFLAGA